MLRDLKIGLFGTHVVRLAGDDFSLIVRQETSGLGDAEIRQLDVAFEGDHDILKAHVAMDDAEGFAVLVGLGVGVCQAAGDAADDEDSQFRRQDAALVQQLLGELFEVHTADQFHGDEENAARFAQMVSLDDVGVDQVGHELGFADEIINELFLVGVVLANDFDGDALDEVAGAALFGLINDPHSALKNLADYVIAKVALNCEQGHGSIVDNFGGESSGQ